MTFFEDGAGQPWEKEAYPWERLSPYFDEDLPTFLITRTALDRPLRGYADAVLMWGETLLFVVSDNRNTVFTLNGTTPA